MLDSDLQRKVIAPNKNAFAVQAIDNLKVEHSNKKQKPAQAADTAKVESSAKKSKPATAAIQTAQAPAKTPAQKEAAPSQGRTTPRRKAADPADAPKAGQELVSKRVKVFWTADKTWYKGSLSEFSAASGKHLCQYDDGDTEWLDLGAEKYELIDDAGGAFIGFQLHRSLCLESAVHRSHSLPVEKVFSSSA